MAVESFRHLRDSLRREPVNWILLGTALVLPGAVLLGIPRSSHAADPLRSAARGAFVFSSAWVALYVGQFVIGVHAGVFAGSEDTCGEAHRSLRRLWAAMIFAFSVMGLSRALLPAEAVARAWGILFGGFLVLTGNRYPQLRVPSPFGVTLQPGGFSDRSSWSEPTWRKVQRFGGRFYVLSGIVTIAGALLVPTDLLGEYGSLWCLTAFAAPSVYVLVLSLREKAAV
jgi:hypothetical protein